MKSLFVFAAATAAVLTSAAFATPGPGSGIPQETRRAGDRLTIPTDDPAQMCKSAYRDHGGQISCAGQMPAQN